MAYRVAINGLGRIGRAILRAYFERETQPDFEIVAVNDLGSIAMNALLLERDTIHGHFPGVTHTQNTLEVRGKSIQYFSERNPAELPWKDLKIDLVMECTGFFTEREKAALHQSAGAPLVLVSAPGKNADKTIVYGVNHEVVEATDTIISNASCTTNCLSPVAHVLNKAFGIESGFIVTVHSITNNQVLLDVAHDEPRRARCAFENIIPTKTGAAKAVGLILPELAGRLDGYALRVPTANVSMVNVSFVFKEEVSREAIHDALKKASQTTLNGIMACNELPLVSSDFNHDAHSVSVDLPLTNTYGRHATLALWYDNEWGFANRMIDSATHFLKTAQPSAN